MTGVLFLDASLGYAVLDKNKFRFSPFAGIGTMGIFPLKENEEETPELKEVSLKLTTTYITGINFDIKFSNSGDYDYSIIRISYGYCIPRFQKRYDGLSGNMHYISVGFAGVFRDLKHLY